MSEESPRQRFIHNQNAVAAVASAMIIALSGLLAATINRARSSSPGPTPVIKVVLASSPSPTTTEIPVPTAAPSATPAPPPTSQTTGSSLPLPTPAAGLPPALTVSPGGQAALLGSVWWVCTGDLALSKDGGSFTSLSGPDPTTGLVLIAEPHHRLAIRAPHGARCDPAPAAADQRQAFLQAKISDMLALGCGGNKGCRSVTVVDQGDLRTTYSVSK